jgi:hypothetical protein
MTATQVPLIDRLRLVPELAVRLYLGAKVTAEDGVRVVELDGSARRAPADVYDQAVGIAKALQIRPRRAEYATDILELRHHAEELFIEEIMGTRSLPQILFVPAQDMASAFYRARIPADVLTDSGRAIAHYTTRLDVAKAARYQVLWVQLVVSPILTAIVRQAKAAGVKIVYDVDDRFDEIPEGNPAAELYVKEKQDEVWEMIELADLVTVSTPALYQFVEGRAHAARVVPNMIPASIWPSAAAPDPSITKILWAGSPTHGRDLSIVASALRAVLERHQGKVRFACFGQNVPEELMAVAAYVDRLPFVAFDEYADQLSDVGADFAIAPLERSLFNDAKSAVKYLEYAASGYPAFCSPVGEYPALGALGAPLTLVKDDQWEGQLELAVQDKAAFRRTAASAQEWVRENRCVLRAKAQPWLEVAQALVGATP